MGDTGGLIVRRVIIGAAALTSTVVAGALPAAAVKVHRTTHPNAALAQEVRSRLLQVSNLPMGWSVDHHR